MRNTDLSQDVLYKHFSSNASDAELEQIMAWVEDSPKNKKRFAKERKIYDATMLLIDEEEIEDVLSRKDVNKISLTKIVRRSMQVAAILAVAVIALWRVNMHPGMNNMTQQDCTISVPVGQRVNVILPDGSNVWLNSLSTLEYPSSFNKKSRTVKLNGQAYFDVAKNKKVPFIVNTDKGEIEVTGTKFDVKSYSNSDQFEAMLMEGSIKIAMKNDPSNPILLTPDTKAVLKNGQLVLSHVTNLDPYKWKDGIICFSGSSLRDMLDQFEKTFDVSIILRDDFADDIRYSGKFRMSEGLHYALRILQSEAIFVFEEDRENNIIYINHAQ